MFQIVFYLAIFLCASPLSYAGPCQSKHTSHLTDDDLLEQVKAEFRAIGSVIEKIQQCTDLTYKDLIDDLKRLPTLEYTERPSEGVYIFQHKRHQEFRVVLGLMVEDLNDKVQMREKFDLYRKFQCHNNVLDVHALQRNPSEHSIEQITCHHLKSYTSFCQTPGAYERSYYVESDHFERYTLGCNISEELNFAERGLVDTNHTTGMSVEQFITDLKRRNFKKYGEFPGLTPFFHRGNPKEFKDDVEEMEKLIADGEKKLKEEVENEVKKTIYEVYQKDIDDKVQEKTGKRFCDNQQFIDRLSVSLREGFRREARKVTQFVRKQQSRVRALKVRMKSLKKQLDRLKEKANPEGRNAVKKLIFSNNFFSSKGAIEIINFVLSGFYPNVEEIDFSFNQISLRDNNFAVLMQRIHALALEKKKLKINLSGNDLDIKKIMEYMTEDKYKAIKITATDKSERKNKKKTLASLRRKIQQQEIILERLKRDVQQQKTDHESLIEQHESLKKQLEEEIKKFNKQLEREIREFNELIIKNKVIYKNY